MAAPRRLAVELVAGFRPVWSTAAAQRAARAAVVVPGLFALASQVIGNAQIATFAAFGGFATLVLASFGGRRRDRLVAHLGLALAGSALLVVGTLVHDHTAVAALVAAVVAFVVLFAGVLSANAASGATAALLAFVLPAASPGTLGMIPSRLEGWWMASAAGTVAVLVVFTRPPVDRLRQAAATCARGLGDALAAATSGAPALPGPDLVAAKEQLLAAVAATPRPTGLTVTDQAVAGLVEGLQWCTAAVAQATQETHCAEATDGDRRRLVCSSTALLLTGELIESGSAQGLEDAVADLDDSLSHEVTVDLAAPTGWGTGGLHRAFHSRAVAAAARSVALDALIAARRVAPDDAALELRRWRGEGAGAPALRHPLVRAATRIVEGQTNLRSFWFLNSARGAFALAAAVAVADGTSVQHGFWVVLGALSVLRTSAASTGATALRALLGTVIGVVVGGALILAIGTHTDVLWAALPVAVLVAAYAPGTAPFAVGQAAFTVTITVLYNLIAPVGWKVGELRVEDIAIGVAVAAVAGVLFWPRGAVSVVADDLAEAFHAGGVHLVQSVSWALGLRRDRPDGGPAVAAAAIRLEDALRGLLADQGTARVSRQALWRLVGGTLRLRLVAQALADTAPPAPRSADHATRHLVADAVRVAGRYDGLASHLGGAAPTVAQELARLDLDGEAEAAGADDLAAAWVRLHLDHLRQTLDDLHAPAVAVADRRREPWWR